MTKQEVKEDKYISRSLASASGPKSKQTLQRAKSGSSATFKVIRKTKTKKGFRIAFLKYSVRGAQPARPDPPL
jgi:hypothetical protein